MYDFSNRSTKKPESTNISTIKDVLPKAEPPGWPSFSAEKSIDHAAVQMMNDRTVVGGRPKGWAIDGAMGNHVSAYKMHKGVVQTALDANDIKGSTKRMKELALHLREHPAYTALKKKKVDLDIVDEHLKNLDATIKDLEKATDSNLQVSLLQEAGKHYLAAHEVMPGAVAFTGPSGGKAEGKALSISEMSRIFSKRKGESYKEKIKSSFDIMADNRIYKNMKDKLAEQKLVEQKKKGPKVNENEFLEKKMPLMSNISSMRNLPEHMAKGHVHSIEAASIAMGFTKDGLTEYLYGDKDSAVDHYTEHMKSQEGNSQDMRAGLPGNLADKKDDENRDSANFAVSLRLSKSDNKILGANIKPRPGGNLDTSEGMGSHLTNWGTHVAKMNQELQFKSLSDAESNLKKVAEQININREIAKGMIDLPGNVEKVNIDSPKIVGKKEKEKVGPEENIIDVQKKARDLMIYMNKSKGSAAPNGINNNRNESGHLKTVMKAERGGGGKEPDSTELSKAYHGLLDLTSLEPSVGLNRTSPTDDEHKASSTNKILAYTLHVQNMKGLSSKAVEAAAEQHKGLETSSGIEYTHIFETMKTAKTAEEVLSLFKGEELHDFARHISYLQPDTKSNDGANEYTEDINLSKLPELSVKTRSMSNIKQKIKIEDSENMIETESIDKDFIESLSAHDSWKSGKSDKSMTSAKINRIKYQGPSGSIFVKKNEYDHEESKISDKAGTYLSEDEDDIFVPKKLKSENNKKRKHDKVMIGVDELDNIKLKANKTTKNSK